MSNEYDEAEAAEVQKVAIVMRDAAGAHQPKPNGLRTVRASLALACGFIRATGGDLDLLAALLAEAYEATEAGLTEKP